MTKYPGNKVVDTLQTLSDSAFEQNRTTYSDMVRLLCNVHKNLDPHKHSLIQYIAFKFARGVPRSVSSTTRCNFTV